MNSTVARAAATAQESLSTADEDEPIGKDTSVGLNADISDACTSSILKTENDDTVSHDKYATLEYLKLGNTGGSRVLRRDHAAVEKDRLLLLVPKVTSEDGEVEDIRNSISDWHDEQNSTDMQLSPNCKQPSRKRQFSAAQLQCKECTFKAANREKLKMHVTAAHGEGESFSCCLCSFETKWNREYYKHMRLHFPGPPYHCDFDYCNAKCDRIQHLLYHRMNHTKERPYSCTFCPMKFKIKSTMTVHLRKHTGDNPFTCSDCSRSFSTKGALQQHAVTHSEKRSFLCDQCGFSTKHQSHLISHRRVHAGDVLHCQLENCPYKTTKRSQLIAHMQSHLRIKTFFCDQCGQGFVAKSHLKRHQLTHIPNKPFSCDVCDYSSNRKDKLRHHVWKHHGLSSDSVADCETKPQTAPSIRHRRRSDLDAPDTDNSYSSRIKFQKMVQKVDEQLRNRSITKYTKLPRLPENDGNGKCIDLSGARISDSCESAAVHPHLVESVEVQMLREQNVEGT